MKTLIKLHLLLVCLFTWPALLTNAATTNAISAGQIISGSITAPGQTNFYSFTAASNDVIYLSVLLTNGVGSPYIYLYDPEGAVLTEGAANAIYGGAENRRLTRTGTYTVGIIDGFHNRSFDYVVTVNLAKGGANGREAGDGPEAIPPGQFSYGHIGASADYDSFTFTAASNDVIYLSVLLTNGVGSPYIYLYDPEGAVLTEGAANAIYGGAENRRLTRTGTYTVGIIDGFHNRSFDYVVTVNLAKGGANGREAGDGPEAIPPGQFSYGHIGASADYDSFTFTAASNDVVYLSVLLTNGVGSPYIYLYDPEGAVLTEGAANAIYGGAENRRLTRTGTYTVGIIDGFHYRSFDYVVTVNLAKGGANGREAGDGPEAIPPGQFSYGHIGASADYDSFTFTAASNDVVYLSVLLTNGVGSPYIYLYDPEGAVLTEGAANAIYGGAENRRLTRTGTYIVGIIDGFHNRSFDYVVTVNLAKGGANGREAGDGPEAIPPGQFSYGHIGASADYDSFTFTAASNDVVYLSVLLTNGVGSPYIYLYDPEGAVLTEGAANAIYGGAENRRLTRTGTYTVGIIDGFHYRSFEYLVSVLKIPGPNATDPGEGLYKLSPIDARSAHLSLCDLDAFEIQAIAGDTLDVAIHITSGPGQNPVLHIYDPDANLIQTVSGATRARLRLPCVSQTGAYTVVIHDDGYNEAYDYQLTLVQYPVVPESDGLNQFLAICECTNRVVVRWETNAQPLGFVLEANPVVDGLTLPEWMASPNWSPVAAPFQVIGDHFYFTEPPTNATKFYRLKRAN